MIVDSVSNLAEALGLLIVLILILVATYYTTKFIAKTTGNRMSSRNIEVVDTFRIAPTKYIQIIKVAGHFLVVAVTKDNVELLTEVSEEDVDQIKDVPESPISFADVLNKKKKNK